MNVVRNFFENDVSIRDVTSVVEGLTEIAQMSRNPKRLALTGEEICQRLAGQLTSPDARRVPRVPEDIRDADVASILDAALAVQL